MKKLLILIVLLGASFIAKADTDTLIVESTVICNMCKSKIEDNIKFEKGVRYVEVNLEDKTVMVIYNADRTTPENIKIAITELGYAADDIPADDEAYEELPNCCKKGSSCSDK